MRLSFLTFRSKFALVSNMYSYVYQHILSRTVNGQHLVFLWAFCPELLCFELLLHFKCVFYSCVFDFLYLLSALLLLLKAHVFLSVQSMSNDRQRYAWLCVIHYMLTPTINFTLLFSSALCNVTFMSSNQSSSQHLTLKYATDMLIFRL